jgi:hypothetical protein
MKRTICLPVLMMIVSTTTPPARARTPPNQRTIAGALDRWISNTETHVLAVAEVMPADRYSYAPAVTAGNFQGVRTFAEQVKHLAANNYRMAALIRGRRRRLTWTMNPDQIRSGRNRRSSII